LRRIASPFCSNISGSFAALDALAMGSNACSEQQVRTNDVKPTNRGQSQQRKNEAPALKLSRASYDQVETLCVTDCRDQ